MVGGNNNGVGDVAMEKRWAARRDVQISVDLKCKDVEVVNCQTRDVSLSGAFVEVHRVQPPINTAVNLVFRMGESGQSTHYKVQAKVARATGDGVGVMFEELDVSSFRSLREVLISG